MAIDTKYGTVTLERGNIDEFEPVVVFRAQDALLPELLAEYRRLCTEAGSPAKHLEGIDSAAHAVIEWQRDHHTQIPQSS